MLAAFRSTALLCAVLVSVLAFALPAHGADAMPLAVSRCEYTMKRHALEVLFRNTGTKAISKADFLVMTASGPIQAVEHDGDFAPGSETMRRSYTDMERLHAQAAIHCVPATITYADGTTWQNASVGPDLEHTLVQTPGAPIRIRDCRAMDSEYGPPILHYTFVDRAEQAATGVSIGFVENGVMVAQKDDSGTFAPGIEIVRELQPRSGIVPNDVMNQRCIVLSATLADGTMWKNPSPPVSAAWPPFAADAAPTAGQITITGCDSGRVHYRNDGPLQVTAVDIGLLEDGKVVRTFRNVHTLTAPDETAYGFYQQNDIKIKDERCVPLRVDYADGTEWVNPALKG